MTAQIIIHDSPAPARVRAVSRERGYTQEQVGSVIGLSRMGIVRRFNGDVAFTDRELVALAHEFQVPVGAFFGEASIPPIAQPAVNREAGAAS